MWSLRVSRQLYEGESHDFGVVNSINGRFRSVAGKVATILVVEDEILVRMAAADFLMDAGYLVCGAADAAEAISMLEAGHEIDVVFTDIRMPGLLNGIGLMRYVKERFPSVAVILNSANIPPRDMLGDTVFVAKPYLPRTVLLAVENEIGRREQRVTGEQAASP